MLSHVWCFDRNQPFTLSNMVRLCAVSYLLQEHCLQLAACAQGPVVQLPKHSQCGAQPLPKLLQVTFVTQLGRYGCRNSRKGVFMVTSTFTFCYCCALLFTEAKQPCCTGYAQLLGILGETNTGIRTPQAEIRRGNTPAIPV